MGHVKADRMKLTVNGLVLTEELRVCMACCLILSGCKKKKKNPINVLTLLSKYALVGWRILCRVNSGPEVRQQRVFFTLQH